MHVDIQVDMSKFQPRTLYEATLERTHCSNDICSQEGTPREETHVDTKEELEQEFQISTNTKA